MAFRMELTRKTNDFKKGKRPTVTYHFATDRGEIIVTVKETESFETAVTTAVKMYTKGVM